MPTKTTTLRIPLECLDRWHKLAAEEHRNISSFVIHACEEYCQTVHDAKRNEEIREMYREAWRVTPEETKAILDGMTKE